MDISVIIVSYNVRCYLRQCLDSVWASARKGGLDVEVFVVDNLSSDNTIGYLRAAFTADKFPNLHLVANQRNVGFGRANNQALKRAAGRYILFLNPDTIITEDTLRECYDFAESKEHVGAIGVKMLSATGHFALESRRGLPTPWVAFCKMSGLGSIFPRSRAFGKYYMRYLNENEANEIEIVSGAFMFCSHDALRKCGGFDETFFMYGEDIDLSYRLMLGGYHNWYIPTPILHYKGESTHKGRFKYVHTFYDAMLIFFQKHFRKSSLLLSIPVKTAIILKACMALVKQQCVNFLHYLNPAKEAEILNVLYIGPEDTFEEINAKADSWGFNLNCQTSITEEHTEGYNVIAYDAESSSFAAILHGLEVHNIALGTYYPSRHTMILGGGIYK